MLNYQDYRQHIEELVQAALIGADPVKAVEGKLHRDGRTLIVGDLTYNLGQGRVYLLSVGKAALAMALPALEILGDLLHSALIIAKKGSAVGEGFRDNIISAQAAKVTIVEGNHPLPGADSISATEAASSMLDQAGSDDLVLCLISGGTSALLTQPIVSLAEWQELTSALLASGCSINEFNLVRRNLDRVKGGGLVKMAAPASCISLILSDVVGNPLQDIGSGPTVYSDESPTAALAVLERYGMAEALALEAWRNVKQSLQDANVIPALTGTTKAENAADGPKHDHWHSHNFVVADVRQAATTAMNKAMQLGFVSQLLTAHLEGEAREVGRVAAAIAKDMLPGRCLILGGETTVTLHGEGLGGRNQELALAAAEAIDGLPNTIIASFATDGEDGPTNAAGAVVNGETVGIGRLLGLDPALYLGRNDSFHYFQALDDVALEPEVLEEDRRLGYGSLLKTGPTGTNVNDLLFILSYPE